MHYANDPLKPTAMGFSEESSNGSEMAASFTTTTTMANTRHSNYIVVTPPSFEDRDEETEISALLPTPTSPRKVNFSQSGHSVSFLPSPSSSFLPTSVISNGGPFPPPPPPSAPSRAEQAIQ